MAWNRKFASRSALILGLLFVLLIGLDYLWTAASPQATCASCHEIESSSTAWAISGHRLLGCKECHGTAFSTGLHSLMEKGRMVLLHFTRSGERDVRLNEEQIVEMLENCKRCHGREYAKWTSSGHSATYAAIFLNDKHNSREQLNADCLRCHGMFFEGTIGDLVTPLNTKGPWKLARAEEANRPVIPCLTCHQMHRQGSPAVPPDYANPQKKFYSAPADSTNVMFYYRYEKMYFEAASLPQVSVYDRGRQLDESTDVRQRVCMQCHASNAFHAAGTSDDRTPRGVHEGIGCLDCHDTHSNNARKNCIRCHPAISNCNLDVTTMNTTFANSNSPHNIHFVACADCHPKGIPAKKLSKEFSSN